VFVVLLVELFVLEASVLLTVVTTVPPVPISLEPSLNSVPLVGGIVSVTG